MTVPMAGSLGRAEAFLHACCVVCVQQLLGDSRAASMLCMESDPVDIMLKSPSLNAFSLCKMLAGGAVASLCVTFSGHHVCCMAAAVQYIPIF